MKQQSVLDVLMYLFEHYLETEVEMAVDHPEVRAELVRAGFSEARVGDALSWLDGLSEAALDADGMERANVSSLRVYTPEETERLDVESRGLLLFLEQVGVIDAQARELVVDRALALDTDAIGVEQLKWVVLMVLFNQPGRESDYAWMEDFVFERTADRLH
ncbi:MAG: DUF494 domain-containing protein [Ectothiorhodospiraceae bacterium]|nr:DUF494 domain-containing protein [Chromatiales bacterium]MCP5155062.1 DUF494 domain-containing protein [Ectothiorhodospiraceae bacterium]